MQSMKRTLAGLCLSVVLFASAGRSEADEAIYQQTARSTVVFLKNGRPIGSGVLVDVTNRVVATAEHVTAAFKGGKIEVMFAELADGEPITEFAHYAVNLKKHAISAKVMLSDSRTDIALVQLERLPAGVQAIKVAQKGPLPGSEVHVVGHSDSDKGKVFSYCRGYVRNSAGGPRGMMLHHTPTNRGDSGGPIVNSKGELVGLVSGGTSGMGADEVAYYAFQVFQQMQRNPNFTVPVPLGEPQVRDQAVGLASIQTMLGKALGKTLAAVQ